MRKFEKLQNWEEEETKKREEAENIRENQEASKIIQPIKALRNSCDRKCNKVPETFREVGASLKNVLSKKFKNITAGNLDLENGMKTILLEQAKCEKELKQIKAENIAFFRIHFEKLVELYMELDKFSGIDPKEREGREKSFEEERMRREENLEREKTRIENWYKEIQKRHYVEIGNILSKVSEKMLFRIGIGMIPGIFGVFFGFVFGIELGAGIGLISSIPILILFL